MKSFITDKVHAILDFDNARVRKQTVRCMSITGNPLTIIGSLEASVKFNKSASFIGEFLISSNIKYDCVLGWDFLVRNRLDLRGIESGDRRGYLLVGRHGKTPLTSRISPQDAISGVVESGAETALEDGNLTLFVEWYLTEW